MVVEKGGGSGGGGNEGGEGGAGGLGENITANTHTFTHPPTRTHTHTEENSKLLAVSPKVFRFPDAMHSTAL